MPTSTGRGTSMSRRGDATSAPEAPASPRAPREPGGAKLVSIDNPRASLLVEAYSDGEYADVDARKERGSRLFLFYDTVTERHLSQTPGRYSAVLRPHTGDRGNIPPLSFGVSVGWAPGVPFKCWEEDELAKLVVDAEFRDLSALLASWPIIRTVVFAFHRPDAALLSGAAPPAVAAYIRQKIGELSETRYDAIGTGEQTRDSPDPTPMSEQPGFRNVCEQVARRYAAAHEYEMAHANEVPRRAEQSPMAPVVAMAMSQKPSACPPTTAPSNKSKFCSYTDPFGTRY